jgi:hypothetical protein
MSTWTIKAVALQNISTGIERHKTWDDSACPDAQQGGGGGDEEEEQGNSRCAKMDCHLDDTNFQLLGFFKHRSYDDWMEQLFKHEGVCVWREEE